jgi:hypothetical protein
MRDSRGSVGRDSSVGIATGYGMDGPGIEFRWGVIFSAPVLQHTRPEAHPSCSTPVLEHTQPPIKLVPGLFPGGKGTVRGVDHRPFWCRG